MPRPARSPHCSAPSRRRRGASLVEYVLLVALLAAVCVGAISLLGSSASAKLSAASDALK